MKKALLLFVSVFILFSAPAQVCKDVSVELSAMVQKTPPRITLNWLSNASATSYDIYRKSKTAGSWGSILATVSSTVTQFIDSSVSVGVHYEYRVIRKSGSYTGYGYINSGIEIPEVSSRGKLILIVDSTFITSLSAELTRLEDDLEGDGWKLVRYNVNRNSTVTSVKSKIVTTYNADPLNTKAVFLFGHVPVPYSGNINPDGHPDHLGAWPTDTYYADIDGSWSDISVNSTTASPARTQNVPGDGKFDQSIIASPLELQIGRVDLWDMPAFTLTETQLLKNYLDKDHDYRKKIYSALKRGIVDDNFGYFGGEAFAASGWKNFGPLVGPANVSANDYFTTMTGASYQWSYGCGGGSYTGAGGIGSTTNFTTSNLEGVFTILFGSYFGDFDITNNFLRAPLCQGKTLTNVWSGRPHWVFHHMGMGENIGYDVRESQNNPLIYFSNYAARWVHANLMGDPTLRNDIVSPVSNVVATKAGLNCNISWSASTQTNVLGYNIYMKNAVNTDYVKINSNLIAGTTYTDNCLLHPGVYKYMVRAVVLEVSPSGSYYNMSEGIADTCQNNSSLSVIITSSSATYTNSAFTATFSAFATNATSFSWNFGDGSTGNGPFPIHTYTANGTYTAMIIASNSCASDTAYVTLSFEVGVNEMVLPINGAVVFPNPSAGKITIELTQTTNEPLQVRVYNSEGKMVYKTDNFLNRKELDLGHLGRGIYLLLLSDKEKRSYSRKFTIE